MFDLSLEASFCAVFDIATETVRRSFLESILFVSIFVSFNSQLYPIYVVVLQEKYPLILECAECTKTKASTLVFLNDES